MFVDTLKLAKQLEAAHLSAEQAEAIATAIAEVASGELATKADLQSIETRMQSLETRLSDQVDEMNVAMERITERLDAAGSHIIWVVISVNAVTWLFLLFGTNPVCTDAKVTRWSVDGNSLQGKVGLDRAWRGPTRQGWAGHGRNPSSD